MKQILTAIALFCVIGAGAQVNVKFNATDHQFGKIKQNIPASYVFSFINGGTKPVVIETASADCGCTTPDWTKTPVLPGKTGTVKVTYNAANPGAFKKNVHVKFATEQLPKDVTIEGEVVPAAAPAKAN